METVNILSIIILKEKVFIDIFSKQIRKLSIAITGRNTAFIYLLSLSEDVDSNDGINSSTEMILQEIH
jgi:hypothetical protein